jgi:hypothetical protein
MIPGTDGGDATEAELARGRNGHADSAILPRPSRIRCFIFQKQANTLAREHGHGRVTFQQRSYIARTDSRQQRAPAPDPGCAPIGCNRIDPSQVIANFQWNAFAAIMALWTAIQQRRQIELGAANEALEPAAILHITHW